MYSFVVVVVVVFFLEGRGVGWEGVESYRVERKRNSW